ncbi:MAG: hypothetical protein ACON4R_00380 [Akkermansiaceae bacterium]
MSYVLAAIITVHLLLPLRVERSVDFGWPTTNLVNYLVLAIVISPVCWGFYTLFSGWRDYRRIPGLRMLLTTISSAAVAVYLLPLFFFYLMLLIEIINL